MNKIFGAAVISLTSVATAAEAQDIDTVSRIVPPYMSFLKQTYSTPAGQDIIQSTAAGGIADQAFSITAVGIREGRFDQLGARDQYNLLGCHLRDLSIFSGSLALQYSNNPNLPQVKAPFFAQISQNADGAADALSAIGYRQNCQQIRADYATYLLGRPLR